MIEKENIIIVALIMKKSHYMDPNAILQTLQHLSMPPTSTETTTMQHLSSERKQRLGTPI